MATQTVRLVELANGAVTIDLTYNDANGACGTIIVANTSPDPRTVTVTNGTNRTVTRTFAAASTTTVNLPNGILAMVDSITTNIQYLVT